MMHFIITRSYEIYTGLIYDMLLEANRDQVLVSEWNRKYLKTRRSERNFRLEGFFMLFTKFPNDFLKKMIFIRIFSWTFVNSCNTMCAMGVTKTQIIMSGMMLV